MSTRKNSLIEDVNVRNTHVADLGTDELFDRIDGDGSGQIDKEEFNKLYAAIKADTEKEVRAAAHARVPDWPFRSLGSLGPSPSAPTFFRPRSPRRWRWPMRSTPLRSG